MIEAMRDVVGFLMLSIALITVIALTVFVLYLSSSSRAWVREEEDGLESERQWGQKAVEYEQIDKRVQKMKEKGQRDKQAQRERMLRQQAKAK